MILSDGRLAELAADLKAAVAFLTRLPSLRATPVTGADIARAAWAFPLIGLLVGLIGAVVYALAHRAGLPPWPAAALSIAATLLATGCLHEDGLADTLDGFGGGTTREQKLDIMRDSRIGTYGVCALILMLLLRVGAVAGIAATAPAAWALLAAHAGARTTLPVFMSLMPPARQDGLSFAAGRPPQAQVIAAAVLGTLILLLCLGFWLGLAALLSLLVVMALMAWLSGAEIGGQTGDVLGAVEQISEIVILLVALG